MSTLDNRPLGAFERWMVRQSVENCRTAGRDRVLANLTAGGYHRVAEAVAEQTAETPAERFAARALADRLQMLRKLTPEQLERRADALEAGR